MLDKTSLSKPLFKEILQFCSSIVTFLITVKNRFKHLLKVRSLKKFVARTVSFLLSLFLSKL